MPPPIERHTIAPGFSIARIVTGLWQVADMERDGQPLERERAAADMAQYVEAGFTTFDMADHYGSAEDIAGHFRSQYASGGSQPVQMLTKWVPPPGAITRDGVRAAIQRSLDRLKTDAIDLLQFHTWDFAHPVWIDALTWLQELKGEGLIRHLGVTNFDTAHLRIAVNSGIELASNQVCYSLLDRRPLARMTELCVDRRITLLAYGTMAGGFLTDRWLGEAEPDWAAVATASERKYGRFIAAAGGWDALQRLLRAAQLVALHHDVSIANVAARYVLEQPAVGAIIIGARLGERTHLVDNARAFTFALDEADRHALGAALSGLSDIPGDSGDEYRRPPFLTAAGDLRDHLDALPAPFPVERTPSGRTRARSGTRFETLAGYCRAVRDGNRIWVSGTTAVHGDRLIGGSDPAAQMHFVIDKIEGALRSLGSRLEDVVRTRVFVQNIAQWEAVARAHGERFRDILPANTVVQAQLVGPEYLVEVEADAAVTAEKRDR
jgi:aryl-alcohol dehydrogenase-like predicted oxidoreductase/enamine deaminase RidA (YjgF/YER057c/UK114 family)